MNQPICLDLYCKAGGTSRGYQQAGFYVVGVDIESQKNYIGDDFLQADALEVLRILTGGGCIIGQSGRRYWLSDFRLIAASPPCQVHSVLSHLAADHHQDLIPDTRRLLRATGKPYVIENVPGAPLINPVMLCGTGFGLAEPNGAQLRRHRLFETSFSILLVPPCAHIGNTIGIFGKKARNTAEEKRHYSKPKETRGSPPDTILYTLEEARAAMGIDWMNQAELSQAIPPAYTRYIGRQMLEMLEKEAAR